MYDSPEPHVTALTAIPAGGILAGTEGSGYVYRIGSDDSVTVLLDAPQREITDLLWHEGSVYAAAFGAGESGDGAGANGNGGARPAARTPTNGSPSTAAGAVYRIAGDGLVHTLWSDETEGPYALALRGGDEVIVGTGPEGRLLSLSEARVGLVSDLEAGQIVGLLAGSSRLLVATSNPAGIHVLSTGHRASGELISPVHDAGASTSWGAVRWSADLPSGTSVGIETRSGNTGEPDDTWSPWQPVQREDGAARVESPAARFLQWRATLQTSREMVTPSLRRVEIAFVVRNLPPSLDEMTVHPGGVVYRQNAGFDDGMPFAQVPPAIARRLESSGGGSAAGGFLGRPYYVAGLRTFTWEASDSNDDPLRFDLAVRGEVEEAWKPVAEGLSERMFVLDTRRLPDGPYYARLTVSDASARPAGEGLAGHRESGVFIVDNTAPELSGVSVGSGPVRTLSAVATDATSLIERLEYSVDGGDWRTVRPRDGVADAAREELAVELGELPPGEHTVIVRAVDTAQNVGTSKVVFVVEATGERGNADD
jgi:hypothetical protein